MTKHVRRNDFRRNDHFSFRAQGVLEHIWLRYKNFDPSCFDPLQKVGMSFLRPISAHPCKKCPLRIHSVVWRKKKKKTCHCYSRAHFDKMRRLKRQPTKYSYEMRFTGVDLNITTTMSKKGRMMFDIKTARTEKARAEFCFRTCRLANKLPERVAFFEPLGLKNRILDFMWQYFHQLYLEDQLCTYQIYCDCHNCQNTTRIFW